MKIDHSIVGLIQVYKDEVRTDPLEISITEKRLRAICNERVRVEPRFNSKRYGRPEYCQLAADCAVEIAECAETESLTSVSSENPWSGAG